MSVGAALENFSAGMNQARRRVDKAENLYWMANLRPKIEGEAQARAHISAIAMLGASVRGGCAANGDLHSFTAGVGAVTSTALVFDIGEHYVHPLVFPSGAASILDIPFCANFNRGLYVIAEYAAGEYTHFYLDENTLNAWAQGSYSDGDVVIPSAFQGLKYSASVPALPAAWEADTDYALNDYVVPSTANGFRYKLTAADADPPHTSNTEPTWPTVAGQTVTELIDLTTTRTITVPGINLADENYYKRPWRAGEAITHGAVRFIRPGYHAIASIAGTPGQAIRTTYSRPNFGALADGGTVTDGPAGEITWTVHKTQTITWTCETINATGAAEPNWPTVAGQTVVDGDITWTAETFAVSDSNCPNTGVATICEHKVYAIDPTDAIVRYCATDAPTDWSSLDDAGYLPVGNDFHGSSSRPTALGRFGTFLVVFSADAFQLWQCDTDPANTTLSEVVPSSGTTHPRSVITAHNDCQYMSSLGVRSVKLESYNQSLKTGALGYPADPVSATLIADGTVFGVYEGYDGTARWYSPTSGLGVLHMAAPLEKLSAWMADVIPFDGARGTILSVASLSNGTYFLVDYGTEVMLAQMAPAAMSGQGASTGQAGSDVYRNAGAYAYAPYVCQAAFPFTGDYDQWGSIEFASIGFSADDLWLTTLFDQRQTPPQITWTGDLSAIDPFGAQGAAWTVNRTESVHLTEDSALAGVAPQSAMGPSFAPYVAFSPLDGAALSLLRSIVVPGEPVAEELAYA